MKKLLFAASILAFVAVGCAGEGEKSAEDIALENEIQEMETQIEKIETIKNEIDESSKKLDEALNDL